MTTGTQSMIYFGHPRESLKQPEKRKYRACGVTLGQLVKASVGQADIQRFEIGNLSKRVARRAGVFTSLYLSS